MKSQRRVLGVATTLLPGMLLCLLLIRPLGPAWANSSGVFTFEDVPYYPTNSLIISGHPAAVDEPSYAE